MKPKATAIIVIREYRDEVHNQLIDHVRFNLPDFKFMQHLSKYIRIARPLSEAQNDLYEKIIAKYRKQIKNLGTNYKAILSLPWKTPVISINELDSKPLFNVSNSTMEITFPFNAKNIDELRTLIYDDAKSFLNISSNHYKGNNYRYDFAWDKKSKKWHGPIRSYLFRDLYNFAKKHNFTIDESVQSIVTEVESYGTEEEWTPRVYISNNRLYISHIHESMLPVIEDFNFTDTSIKNIETLCELGLSAPPEFSDINRFVTKQNISDYHELKNNEGIDILNKYLSLSNRKVVYVGNNLETFDNIIKVCKKAKHIERDSTDYYLEGLLKDGYDTIISSRQFGDYEYTDKLIAKLQGINSSLKVLRLIVDTSPENGNNKNNRRSKL